MPQAVRSIPAASGGLDPRHNRLFTAERPLVSLVSDRAEAEDTLDLHALAWVDAFRDHGYAACFNKVRERVAKGGDQVMPMLLSAEELRTFGGKLQAYRDRILELRYLIPATAGQTSGDDRLAGTARA